MPAIKFKCGNTDKCFMRKFHPKLEAFDDCFPGSVGFSDVDSSVELDGKFLFVEWKSGHPRQIKNGQKWWHERLTSLSGKIDSIIAWGDPPSGIVTHLTWIAEGRIGNAVECSTEQFRATLKRWADEASPRRAA